MKCLRCNVDMVPSKAIGQTLVAGVPDFPGDDPADLRVRTLSCGGPGNLIDALKCPQCGHSVTAGEKQ